MEWQHSSTMIFLEVCDFCEGPGALVLSGQQRRRSLVVVAHHVLCNGNS